MLNFKTTQVLADSYPATLLAFDIGGDGILSPDHLGSLSIPQLPWDRGVIISGRGPVWLFATLVHHCHPSQWVAVHDPRLGAVVVQRHTPVAPRVGAVLPFA